MKKGAYSGVRASSVGWAARYSYYTGGTCEHSIPKVRYIPARESERSAECRRKCRDMYDYLSEQPEPVGPYMLCGVVGSRAMSLIDSMTEYHSDIYEEDDGRIGIVGIHAN